MLSAKQRIRYEKHLDLPFFGQEKQEILAQKNVKLIGAGGLGCPIALYLSVSGLGELSIYDDDNVSLSNLQRQILYSDEDLKLSKVERAKIRLRQLNSFCNVEAVSEKICEHNIDSLNNADLIIDATDNFNVRYLLNEYCSENKIPFLTGSVLHYNGQIALFHSHRADNSPCYQCMYPIKPQPNEIPTCADSAVLSPITGTIGTLIAIEAIKEILDIGETLNGNLLLFDALTMQFNKMKISKNNSCSVCDHTN